MFLRILAAMFCIAGIPFLRELCIIEQEVVYTRGKAAGVIFDDSTII